MPFESKLASTETWSYVDIHGRLVEVPESTVESRAKGCALREARLEAGGRLVDGAIVLGISITDLSRVEIGRCVFINESDYATAVERWRSTWG